MSTIKVKICGITNAEDAAAAVEAGADALGFVFHAKSPRCVDAGLVKRIVAGLPPFVLPVGVFVNEDMKKVRDLMDGCGLALAQLHGDETAASCESLGRPVLKAIRLRDRGSLLALAEYKGRVLVRGFVVDAFSTTAYGGTGERADWTLAAEAAKSAPILLAGGLTAENVREAVERVRPYGVDVSSGVEASPGKKDHAKVRAFIQAVKLVST
ncbi:MAG: phosphoribosylanthranilate isomerase [Nitrospirae bacterium]|nr:MAG: phosphoribosylanthranilate isomerase [Nitrospirota bacterium]